MRIDTLSYFLSQHPDQRLETEDGSQSLSQYHVGKCVYTVKTLPNLWERHRWNAKTIDLQFDCSGNGMPWVRAYSMTPGTWMKRRMSVGEEFRVKENMVQFYDMDCKPFNLHRGPYSITLLFQGVLDLGGDLGERICIVVQYHSDELFIYALGWGLVRWDSALDGKPWYSFTFNRIRAGAIMPVSVCGMGI